MEKERLVLQPFAAGLVFSSILALSGCGSSGGASTSADSSAMVTAAPMTLTGTAAGGTAITAGTVSAKCVSGSGTTTAAADGTYTPTLTGVAPCVLQVTDPNNAANVYYSAAQSGTTTANITPLTSLAIANALGAEPATALSSFSSATASNITAGSLSAALTNVSTALVRWELPLDRNG